MNLEQLVSSNLFQFFLVFARLGSAIISALGDGYTIVGFERKCPKTPFDCIEADIGSVTMAGGGIGA
jgi:hypothetical protein